MVIHPAHRSLLKFLVDGAIKACVERVAEPAGFGEPAGNAFIDTTNTSIEAASGATGTKVLSVDEAAQRLGISRAEFLAEFEKHAVQVNLRIPAAGRRRENT